MKHWWEYYLAKHLQKQFDGINISDLDKIISYMSLKLQLGVNFDVRILYNWRDRNTKL